MDHGIELPPEVMDQLEVFDRLRELADSLLGPQVVVLQDKHDAPMGTDLPTAVALTAFWCEDQEQAVRDAVAELKDHFLPKRMPAWCGYGLKFPEPA